MNESVILSGKWKHVVIFLNEKLELIRQLEDGESIRKVVNDLGVGVVTVKQWKIMQAKYNWPTNLWTPNLNCVV